MLCVRCYSCFQLEVIKVYFESFNLFDLKSKNLFGPLAGSIWSYFSSLLLKVGFAILLILLGQLSFAILNQKNQKGSKIKITFSLM